VLTNLGRCGSPVIRYRTGDLVRADPRPCPCGRSLLRLDGGILGRTDDMIHFRGNNLYPSAIEAVVRRFPEVAEFRVEVDQSRTLAALCVEIEPYEPAAGDLAERVAAAIRDELLFRAEVRVVSPGSLPRFEMKARRLKILNRQDAKSAK
jgi:phenylacetate-CoA ligase